MTRLCLGLALVVGCGTGAATSGPPTNPPFSGAGAFAKVPGDYVILDPSGADLTDPSLLADSSQGPFSLWLTRAGVEIWRSDLPRLGTDPAPLRLALAATETWEQGRVAAASVERDANGYHMAYEAAGGVIALADSGDGEHWSGKRMLGAGHAPALVRGFVFYEQGGEIWRAPANTVPPLHLLRGKNPDVHVRQTPGEREVWQMYFNCPGRSSSAAICYAGSFDGEDFATTYIPIVQPDSPDETAPTGFGDATAAVLFFGQISVGFPSKIAAATATAP